jgi:replication-associated recombination protein RarA
MAESTPTPSSLDGVTSLYRRFRPNRFAELRGQDHVVRALQGAVKNDRVSHAYLFSGPREQEKRQLLEFSRKHSTVKIQSTVMRVTNVRAVLQSQEVRLLT